ncbi:MAG: RidA family protein [Sneathiella sp.]
MMVRHISSGSKFEAEIGYSRAVVDDHYVFVAGTTGTNYETMEVPETIEEQVQLCLANIESALIEAGSSLDKVVRVHYILPDRSDFEVCWPFLGKAFAVAKPAATMIQAGLMDPAMKIEIEVTARR